MLSLAPFLAVSVLFAAWSRASGVASLAARVFAGRLALVIPVVALFGAVSPFCSCGVVPVVAALLAAGTALPGVMAFWLSSPLMDPEMFVLTIGELGLRFALARLAAAIGVGLLAGAGLFELGLPAGARLAFMVAGGATSVPAAMAVVPLVRGRVFAWYLTLAFGGALLAGFALTALG